MTARHRIADFYSARLSGRLVVNTQRSETGCWLWMGDTGARRGYARTNVGGKRLRVSRVMWSMANDLKDPPLGYEVAHTCHNPACVRPSHLIAVPPAINTAMSEGTGRRTKGALVGNSKLTADQAREIASLIIERIDHATIPARFGVSRAAVTDIACGRAWRSVTGFVRKRTRPVNVTTHTARALRRLRSAGVTQADAAARLGIGFRLAEEIIAGHVLPTFTLNGGAR